MKKIISVLLSVVMLLSVSTAAVSVFAADNVNSIESTTKGNKITVEVNGNESNDVTYEKDPTDPTKITFTYTGDGELEGWEFPGMTEGVDYKIISEEGDSITIQIINGYDGPIVANAIVKEETTKKKKSNEKKKSPKTGAATVSVAAAAGVGVAMLAALKRKSDEE